jgi:choline dehydrogenase-like flavoprotein
VRRRPSCGSERDPPFCISLLCLPGHGSAESDGPYRCVVERVTFDANRATGVEITHHRRLPHFRASTEVVLSLGAIHTPKVLMQSGVGYENELGRVGIAVRQLLPGVGRYYQHHTVIDCVWEFPEPRPQQLLGGAVVLWKSRPDLDSPDLFAGQAAFPKATPENVARFGLPEHSWFMSGALSHPVSRGQARLSGAAPGDPVQIQTNVLSHPDDIRTAISCIETMQEIGNSAPLRPFVKREVMPGNVKGAELEASVRNGAVTDWHQARRRWAVTQCLSWDGNLKVYGTENLRVADGSIMPRITTANTMAPCVVIGELAAQAIKAGHQC